MKNTLKRTPCMPPRPPAPVRRASAHGSEEVCKTAPAPVRDQVRQVNGWATEAAFTRTLKRVGMDSSVPLDAGGIVLGSDKDGAWIDSMDNHSIILGSTGSQKSRRICMPTISTVARAGEPLVVADCKGELYAETHELLELYGYTVYNLNLKDPAKSSGWNPLAIPYSLYKSGDRDSMSKAQDMVYDLVGLLSPIKGDDPYWDQSAQDVLAGAIFLMFDACDDPEQVNMMGIISTLTQMDDNNSPLFSYMRLLDCSSTVYNCLAGPMYTADNTKHCILGCTRKSLRPFVAHPMISAVLSSNEIDPASLAQGKTAVFITVPDDRTSYNMLVSTFIKQAYSTLVSIADGSPGRRLWRNVTFILDEFGSFPEIPGMSSMITAARSRGVRFILILQGMDQLSHRYGSEVTNTILGNCANLVFINSREMNLLNYISNLVGEDDDGRKLISTSKLQRFDMESGEMMVFHGREYPFITHMVDIEDYGLPKSDEEVADREHPEPKIFQLSKADVYELKRSRRSKDEDIDILELLDA